MPKPACCPFCGRKGCLIGWGFYTVNTKTCLTAVLPVNGVLYIKRFYCKATGRTVSLLPDFLLPRKQYSNTFVEAVLDNLLITGQGLCAVARKYALHYQTILKWLQGLAVRKEVKAICFSRYNPPTDVPDKEYVRKFWNVLTRAFGGVVDGVLAGAGGLLWTEYECPLF